MKTLLATLVLLASLAQAQFATIAGQSTWGDTLRWGGSVDSTSSLLIRGNAVRRDSASSWVVITTDSCSKWVRVERGSQFPVWKYELAYEVRASSGNTDSTQVTFAFDTRYCMDPKGSRNCGSIIPQGRHNGYDDITVKDTVVSQPTTAGTTWKGTTHLLYPGGGNQVRACVDSYQAGGATGDSTFIRRVVLRFQ